MRRPGFQSMWLYTPCKRNGAASALVMLVVIVVMIVVVASEINSYVKMFVIPVRLVIAAPLPGRVHSVHVGIHLPAAFAVARDVAINSCAVCFQASMTVVFPIVVRAGRTAKSQHKPASQSARQKHSTPQSAVDHHRPL